MVKIKALLEGLSGKGISLNTRALAQFTADNGVLVTVRCGRPRGRVSLPPRLLGLQPDKWDKESQDFFSTHVAMGPAGHPRPPSGSELHGQWQLHAAVRLRRIPGRIRGDSG